MTNTTIRKALNCAAACGILLLWSAGAPVSGQASADGGTTLQPGRCQNSDTLMECWQRYQPQEKTPEAVQEAGSTAASGQVSALAAKPTGIDTSGLNLGSATKDFLPLLALSGLLGDSSKEGSDGTIVMDLNFLIPGLAKDRNAQLRLLVDNQPKVSEALEMSLPEATRDETVQKLKENLGDLDDYGVSFTYNWVSSRTGRGFEQYRDRFQSLWYGVRKKYESENQSSDSLRAFGEFMDEHQSELSAIPEDFMGSTFQQMGEALDSSGNPFQQQVQAQQVMALFEKAVVGEANSRQSEEAAVRTAGLASFADLVNNQPQLHASVVRRMREPVVGGDETSFKLTYEWAAANLNNSMSGVCQKALDRPLPSSIAPADLQNCLAEYTLFVDGHAQALDKGNRFSFSTEYVDIEEQRVERPELGVDTTLAGSSKLIVSLGWSRLWDSGFGGPLRLDLMASYENVSDDPMRTDRGIATLTVTRRFGNLSVPFGIVYATRSEFLPDVDERLSAHLGIKFNLFSPKKQ